MSVFVWIETRNGKAVSSSWEALGAAGPLAEALGVDITAIIFGADAAAIAAAAGRHGASNAVICRDLALAEYHLDKYTAQLASLVSARQPSAVLAVATHCGRELLANVALECQSGLISDVFDLRVEDGRVVGTRPVYAGKALMEMAATTATAFVTLRGRAFAPPTLRDQGRANVETAAAVALPETKLLAVENFAEDIGKVRLTDAAIIVSGGRGMANNPVSAPAGISGEEASIWRAKHGFAHTLAPLAEVLGAAIGASRAAVDAGYIAYEHQVGQTGKVVNPDLYIACGISGAIQHQAGMRGSKVIVAINRDPQAPIFKLAHYGIVGDLYEVAPALTAALKKKLS